MKLCTETRISRGVGGCFGGEGGGGGGGWFKPKLFLEGRGMDILWNIQI